MLLQMWAGVGLIALIYCYGFRIWLTLPLGLYFMVTAYQGFHRFRVLIPLILLVQIYVERRGERWPTLKSALLLIFAALMFFPLKGVARELQEGEDLTYVFQHIQESVEQAVHGENDDELILDQFASALTLADDSFPHFTSRSS
jgi:hypothetical protein